MPPSLPPSLASLPRELLDEILSELDEVKDLLSLALTSRRNANGVIPYHIEYRKIRIRTPMPTLWAHLVRRADLARNIREIQLCARHDYTAPDRFPVTLVDNSRHDDDEEQRVKDVCAALGQMKRLSTFVWQYELDLKAGHRRLNHRHEEMILSSLSKVPGLRHLMLRGECGVHVRDGKGIERQPYPLWNIRGLRSLSLLGAAWTNTSNSADIIRFIQSSPNLEYLEVPMELQGLESCRLPRLKRVGLPMTSGVSAASSSSGSGVPTDPVTGFLQKNPTIEELNWTPMATTGPPCDSLPNLRCLKGNYAVIGRWETQPTIQRHVECLDLWDVSSDRLPALALDASALRKLSITQVGSLASLYTIAKTFMSITWLRLPSGPIGTRPSLDAAFELPRLLDILSCFTNLEVFRGSALWKAVGGESQKERMHEAILDLIERCPRLRQLDHSSYNEKRNAVKLIKIYRKENLERKLEQVWYEIHHPPSQGAFDIMSRTFD